MSTDITYSRTGNEIVANGRDESDALTVTKVAVIDKNGELRMSKGQAEHREAVEAFLKESGAEIEAPGEEAEEENAKDPIEWNPFNEVVQDHRDGTVIQPDTDQEREARGLSPWLHPAKTRDGQEWTPVSPPQDSENISSDTGEIPPCPPEDDHAGDKTPEVIKWWFTYHPEEAAKKYAGRKFDMPTLD